MSELLRIRDEACEIAIDRRYAPLYLTRWSGGLTLGVLAEVQAWFLEVGQASVGAGLRVAYVNDLNGLERTERQVQRAFVESAAQLRPVIRGVLAMARGVTVRDDEDQFVSSWSEGIEGALAALAAAGITGIDIDPRRYEFPP